MLAVNCLDFIVKAVLSSFKQPSCNITIEGDSINMGFFVRVRNPRAQDRSVNELHEDLSTGFRPQRLAPAKLLWVSRKKTINRDVLETI
jgi:hypothetical protein